MAVSVVRGQLRRTRSDRRRAIFPMFVAEQPQRLWHLFRWDPPVVYLSNEQKAAILFTSLTSRVRFPESPDCHSEYSARLIFSLFILFWSVVRFSPRRSAAPPLPAILPDAAIKASIIACRSACSKLGTAEVTERTDGFFSSERRTFNSSPCVKITQRSMKFSSCRILPGQSAFTSASMACFGTDLTRFCISRECRKTKK